MTHVPCTFAWPAAAWAAGAISLAAAVVAVLRRPAVPAMTRWLVFTGLVLLSLAAGGMTWRGPAAGEIAVMVDLSPSTRSAEYRDRSILETRIQRLMGSTPYHVYYFADGAGVANPFGPNLPARLPDLPADRTRFEPPGAAGVILFSDGRFQLPAAAVGLPPIYPVIDIGMENPPDGAIAGLEIADRDVIVRIRNEGGDRQLSVSGSSGKSPTTAPTGEYVVARRLVPADSTTAAAIEAQLNAGDLWPENDRLESPLPPPRQSQRWLVASNGAAAAPDGWLVMAPEALPVEPSAYLAPSVIVLSDVAAGRLSGVRQDRLNQYVRDLGGTLLILGGEHAFAAGAYPGSGLEAMSPLSSTPPRPTAHWIFLADSSGSMNLTVGGARGASLWHYATDAIVKVLPALPPEDRVSVGSFAEIITWWSVDQSARQTAAKSLPPSNAFPNGPTNLRPALDAVVRQADSGVPVEFFLLTDADADVGDPAPLIDAMKARHMRLFLLALGEGRGLDALRRVVDATGGRLLRQDDASQWSRDVEQLLRSAQPNRLKSSTLSVRFIDVLAAQGSRQVSLWNRTWLKAGATGLAEADFAGQQVVPAARWDVGEGQVLAVGFTLGADSLDQIAKSLGRSPRDPRYRVTWESNAMLTVHVDAASLSSPQDPGHYLNGEQLKLELMHEPAGQAEQTSLVVPQTGPGQYAISIPSPRVASIATLRTGENHVADRIAVAGRYAPEFEAVGNDLANLRTLAERTGGAIIPPRQMTPIDFTWPLGDQPLESVLAGAGGLFIALGLIRWRGIAAFNSL